MQNAHYIAALQGIRDGVEGAAKDKLLRELATSLGTNNAKTSTLHAMTAVISQLAWPERYSRDKDAWEQHDAKESNFRKWKAQIGNVARAVDMAAAPLERPSRSGGSSSFGQPTGTGGGECRPAANDALPDSSVSSSFGQHGVEVQPADTDALTTIEELCSTSELLQLLDDHSAPATVPPASDSTAVPPILVPSAPVPVSASATSATTTPAASTAAASTAAAAASDTAASNPADFDATDASKAALDAPCAREGCRCVSYNGLPGEYCCRTCRGSHIKPGRACCDERDPLRIIHPVRQEEPKPRPARPPASEAGFAPCARTGCPCSASFDGLEGHYCCITCRDGKACRDDYHQKPVRRPAKGKRF